MLCKWKIDRCHLTDKKRSNRQLKGFIESSDRTFQNIFLFQKQHLLYKIWGNVASSQKKKLCAAAVKSWGLFYITIATTATLSDLQSSLCLENKELAVIFWAITTTFWKLGLNCLKRFPDCFKDRRHFYWLNFEFTALEFMKNANDLDRNPLFNVWVENRRGDDRPESKV